MQKMRLAPICWTLSATVDLVGVTDILHGRRVAYYALEIARHSNSKLPWSEHDIIVAALLHDIGVSSTETHERLVQEMQWVGAQNHCVRGESLLAVIPCLKSLASAVKLHHSPWQKTLSSQVLEADLRLGNLIFLADRLDVLIANQVDDILFVKNQLLQRLTQLSPKLFAPEWIEALEKASVADAFWLVRTEAALDRYFREWLECDSWQMMSEEDISALFGLFGECVDAKSPYTAEHSRAVALLARELGLALGLGAHHADRVMWAGLVHDIGKLRVPDLILDKNAGLDPLEFSVIKHHSFDTYDILGRLEGFKDVAKWASLHHERMNGTGYPYHLSGAEIPLEARILAVADIFQALAQDRPYRRGMEIGQIQNIMDQQCEDGLIDPQVWQTLKDQMDEYFDLAHRISK